MQITAQRDADLPGQSDCLAARVRPLHGDRNCGRLGLERLAPPEVGQHSEVAGSAQTRRILGEQKCVRPNRPERKLERNLDLDVCLLEIVPRDRCRVGCFGRPGHDLEMNCRLDHGQRYGQGSVGVPVDVL